MPAAITVRNDPAIQTDPLPDTEDRLARLEGAVVAIAAHVDETIPEVEAIQADKMLGDWTAMQDRLMADEGVDRGTADNMLDQYFTDITEGRRDNEGNWLGD